MNCRRSIPVLVAALCLAGNASAQVTSQCVYYSQPNQAPAAKLIVLDGTSTATAQFCGGSAGYTSDVYLVDPSFQYIGTGHVTPAGTEIDLGAFLAGDELIFSIYVRNTGLTYYTGPGERNPDGQVHAAVTQLTSNEWHLGFEDLVGGGDRDYDDINIIVHVEASLVKPDDTDTDGDGIRDYDDNCREVANADQADVDGNGIGDACEEAAVVDTDGDGLGDDTDP